MFMQRRLMGGKGTPPPGKLGDVPPPGKINTFWLQKLLFTVIITNFKQFYIYNVRSVCDPSSFRSQVSMNRKMIKAFFQLQIS